MVQQVKLEVGSQCVPVVQLDELGVGPRCVSVVQLYELEVSSSCVSVEHLGELEVGSRCVSVVQLFELEVGVSALESTGPTTNRHKFDSFRESTKHTVLEVNKAPQSFKQQKGIRTIRLT